MFRVADVVRQNVASRIVIYSGNGFDMDDVCSKISWASTADGEKSYVSQKLIESITGRLLEGDQILVYLEPSVGAEAVLLCRSIAQERA